MVLFNNESETAYKNEVEATNNGSSKRYTNDDAKKVLNEGWEGWPTYFLQLGEDALEVGDWINHSTRQ